MLGCLNPWRSRPAANPEQIDVGILAASGDVVVMYPGEGIPRCCWGSCGTGVIRQ